jgi:hypothetical protein
MFIKYKKHFVIVKTNKSYVLVSLTITKLVYEIFVFHENEKSTLLHWNYIVNDVDTTKSSL